MPFLLENDIACPYCGETISILVDESVEQQSYIEDCQVCCRPIVIRVKISSEGECQVTAHHENDS